MTTRLYQPINDNILQLSKFSIIIPNLKTSQYYCQDVTFPGVSTTAAEVPTPFVSTYRHGDKLTYEVLGVTIICDEDMRAWEEIYNWFRSFTFPHEFPEYKGTSYQDITLIPHKNSNLANFKVKYIDCHPTSLSGLRFSTKTGPEQIPTFDISIRYDTFFIERTI